MVSRVSILVCKIRSLSQQSDLNSRSISLSEEFDLSPKSLISVSISVWTIRSQESDLNSVNLGL